MLNLREMQMKTSGEKSQLLQLRLATEADKKEWNKVIEKSNNVFKDIYRNKILNFGSEIKL